MLFVSYFIPVANVRLVVRSAVTGPNSSCWGFLSLHSLKYHATDKQYTSRAGLSVGLKWLVCYPSSVYWLF